MLFPLDSVPAEYSPTDELHRRELAAGGEGLSNIHSSINEIMLAAVASG
jgi:hypothetical protein